MNRRNLAAGVSLLALSACAAISTATSTSTEAGINQAVAIAQGILNYASPLVPLIAAFIPGASPPVVISAILFIFIVFS